MAADDGALCLAARAGDERHLCIDERARQPPNSERRFSATRATESGYDDMFHAASAIDDAIFISRRQPLPPADGASADILKITRLRRFLRDFLFSARL